MCQVVGVFPLTWGKISDSYSSFVFSKTQFSPKWGHIFFQNQFCFCSPSTAELQAFYHSPLCLHSGVLTNKLKIIVLFREESFSVQTILLTHFEVLIKPNPSRRSQTSRVSLVFAVSAIFDVSLNQLTPQSLSDLSFHHMLCSPALFCEAAAYVSFSVSFLSGQYNPRGR